jgi:hypothetical protein
VRLRGQIGPPNRPDKAKSSLHRAMVCPQSRGFLRFAACAKSLKSGGFAQRNQ